MSYPLSMRECSQKFNTCTRCFVRRRIPQADRETVPVAKFRTPLPVSFILVFFHSLLRPTVSLNFPIHSAGITPTEICSHARKTGTDASVETFGPCLHIWPVKTELKASSRTELRILVRTQLWMRAQSSFFPIQS